MIFNHNKEHATHSCCSGDKDGKCCCAKQGHANCSCNKKHTKEK